MTTTLKPHLNTVNAAIHLNFDNDLKLCINFGLSSETDNQVTNITENSKYDYVQIPETGTIEICILDADNKPTWIENGSRGFVPVDALPELIVAVRGGDKEMFDMFMEMLDKMAEEPADA
jgi:hypothetical protein|tara:strand:- start:2496 stop:2855 length:360 start_codon:yes stop_codon:yes gene_type:complete